MASATSGIRHPEPPATHDPERGSAIVEFIFTSTLVLVPMIYLVLAAGAVQGASYAVVGAADHAAKVFAASADEGNAEANARDVVSLALADFGIPATRSSTQISCDPVCLDPGSTVTVLVAVDVPLPFLPEGFNVSAVSVDSAATARVDRFG